GIRDGHVTGVQTCALPIWPAWRPLTLQSREPARVRSKWVALGWNARRRFAGRVDQRDEIARAETTIARSTEVRAPGTEPRPHSRSEERRVGKECRARGWTV